ncbi:hypothetical protein FWF48_02610 [Candidatus Saccharibacteria bacterium]|nr:hypothetical protein [Candidatus Saccharibacteria bacterium]
MNKNGSAKPSKEMNDKSEPITIISASLIERNGEVVLRGVIHRDSLMNLQVDRSYQREELTETKISKLAEAMRQGETVPDIDASMRGEEWEAVDDHTVILKDPVFVVDGQQRLSAAMDVASSGNCDPSLGVLLHMGKNRAWEVDRFEILNSTQTRVAPDILLRNSVEKYPGMNVLFNITNDENFVLYHKVCWNQNMKVGELIRSTALVRAALYLHKQVGSYSMHGAREMALAADKIYEEFGHSIQFRKNIVYFFDLVDECWDIRNITYVREAVHIKALFLTTLAKVLSDHQNFWKQQELFVEVSLRRKLKQFNLMDPTVRGIIKNSQSSQPHDELYKMIVDHLNSGRRTYRLRPVLDEITDFDQAS